MSVNSVKFKLSGVVGGNNDEGKRGMEEEGRERLLAPEEFGDDDVPPPDKWNLAYFIFFLLGLSTLFPWNTFISLPEYFQWRMCPDDDLMESFMGVFAMLYNISTLTTLFIAIKYQQLFSPTFRVVLALSLQTIVFIVITTVVFYPDMDPDFFFRLHCGMILVAGFGTGVLQGALFGFAAQLPGKFTGVLMSGQGLAGVTVSGVSLLGSAVRGVNPEPDICKRPYSDEKPLATVFFGAAVATLLICMLSFLLLERLPFIRFYRQRAVAIESAQLLKEEKRILEENPASAGLLSATVVSKKPHVKLSDIWRVAGTIIRPALCVMGVFFVTLSMFPAVTASIVAPESGLFFQDLFVPFSFFSFNVFDTIGRTLPAYVQYPGDPRSAWAWVLLRVIFLPLFLLCRTSDDSVIPTLFESGWWSMLFMAVFALSNGYLSTAMMIYGPTQAKLEDQKVAGTAMVVFLTLGLAAGGTSSVVWKPLL